MLMLIPWIKSNSLGESEVGLKKVDTLTSSMEHSKEFCKISTTIRSILKMDFMN